ncbi:MAG: flagellar hook-length control protein FliK [Buchnera aphidicola (Macrosiphum albifrons)]|uniref:Flagellar hook-length control protein FliK n=1 Tax=Buchnera aphidicola (Macrosiphum albifrons) TaxID=2994844 RepID=A0AAJ5TWV4_9GAMM|nr:MAG: flagellar hook-length control protein FliK [Buchnera aphidicola (Macrosiphum albifrons)]
MLEIICNIASQKNTSFKKSHNFFDIIYESDLSKSIFNELNKFLLTKEMAFDNVLTEEKKDDDKSIICANFISNNLLNILIEKDIVIDSKNFNNINDDKTHKKKIDKDENSLLHTIHLLKNIKIFKIKKNKKVFKMLQTETLLNTLAKNKNEFKKTDKLNNISIINDLCLKKINNQISDINKSKVKLKKDEKKIIFSFNIKKNKNISSLYKNVNTIGNMIDKRNLLEIFHKQEPIKLNIKPLILNDTKNSIEWKKLISQKILLSIFNKYNQAEIHLKPEYLGSIHIIISMKNNAVRLKFISKYNEIRKFLDSYMPFLRNSLTNNGIKLEEFNIYSSLKNKKLKIYKNIDYINNFKKTFNIHERNLNSIKHTPVDILV